jgi:hypothetical protein
MPRTGFGPHDPPPFAALGALLVIVAGVAGYVARRKV